MRNRQRSAGLVVAALLLILPIGGVAQTPAPVVQGVIATVTGSGAIGSFNVNDVRNVAGVKVGDRIQISYNRALVISVK